MPVSRMFCHAPTELCTCAADIDKCGNAITSELKHDYNEEEEEYKNKETVCAK